MTTIRETRNYAMFDLHWMNRPVKRNKNHFHRLVKSMKTHGFLAPFPLHCVVGVDGRLQVKSGHNRLWAAQEAGVPVKYVISDDAAPISDLERGGAGPWKPQEFMESYAKAGYSDYVEIHRYIEETGIRFSCAMAMFDGGTAGSANYTRGNDFFNGLFRIKDRVHPYVVADIVSTMQSLGCKWAVESSCVVALSKATRISEFDPDRFKDKLEKHTHLAGKQRSADAYLDMIEEVYNRHVAAKKKVNIAFLAREAARIRSRSARKSSE